MMANEGSWGGLMSIYDDCVMLLDDGAGSAPVSAPWVSHDPFDFNANSVCPNQLVLGQEFLEHGHGIGDVEYLQSPSESAWETVYDSDSEGSELQLETVEQDDDVEESVVGSEIWDEFMDMMESRDTSRSENTEVDDRVLNGKQDERVQEVIPVDSVEVEAVAAKDEKDTYETAPKDGCTCQNRRESQ